MDGSIIFLFAGIIIVGAVFLAFISSSRGCPRKLNIEHYRARCLEVEHQLKKDDPASYQLSVMNADKLLDQALREKGLKGKTMGERMKSAANSFSDRNGIWQAHILRNKISHEVGFNLSYDDASRALASFRKALKDLGAI